MSCALLFLGLLPLHAAADSIWSVDIDEGPAPPPDKGPPLSRNAIRDPDMLKWQIVGIVGGYVLAVMILFSLLLTVGKRLRRAAQSSSSTLSMEMVKPNRWAKGQEAAAHSRWDKFRAPKQIGGGQDSAAPEYHGPVTFDENVIKQDKLRQEQDMERLYAAVMSNNTKSPKQVQIETQEVRDTNGRSQYPSHNRNPSSSSSQRSFSQHVAHYASANARTAPPPNTTQALYPPYGPMPSDRNAPMFSQRDIYAHTSPGAPPLPPPPTDYRPVSTSPPPLPPPPSDAMSPRSTRSQHSRHPSASSQISTKSHATTSSRRRTNYSAKLISSPVPIPHPSMADFADDNETTPLTPTSPPLPPQSSRIPTSRLRERPVTPIQDAGDATDIEEGSDDDNDDAGSHIISHYSYSREPRRQMPSAAPQRHPQSGMSLSAPLQPPSRTTTPASITSTQRSTPKPLPFRAYGPSSSTASSQQQLMNPLGMAPIPTTGGIVSPGPTKTTLLSPRRDAFGRGGNGAALISAGLATPYSPYMPFSPVTPVTPRLVGRDERRRRERENGRRVITEEDEVRADEEVWGDSWR